MSLSHYIELKAIPQAELTQAEVLSHLMQHIHRLLPAYAGRIGIAFPATASSAPSAASSACLAARPTCKHCTPACKPWPIMP